MESPSPQLAAFELHLRELDLPESPADTADFSRPIVDPSREFDADGDIDQLILDSAALTAGFLRLPSAPECRLIPLFDASTWPIPIPEPEIERADGGAPPAKPDASPWDIGESRQTVVSVLPRHDHLRTAIAAAITLPLILTATPALATSAPEVQRPTATAAPQPEPAAEPAQPLPAEPEPPVVEAPPLEPVPAAEPEPAPEPTPPEAFVAPSPAATEFEGHAAAPGQGVPETLWQAMKGLEVKLMLPSGSRRGRLAAVDGPEVVFIDQASGGRLYSIPKVQVMELRGVVSSGMTRASGRPYGVPDPALPTGGGLLAGGIVATSIGTPFLISAAVFGIACPSCSSVTLPLLIPAVLGLGAGIPMLVFGTRRRKAWNASKVETARLTPSFGGNRNGGWTGSLTLRF